MIDSGEVANLAELARNLGLSRARLTQVMNVLKVDNEALLYLSYQNLRYGLTEIYLRQVGIFQYSENS